MTNRTKQVQFRMPEKMHKELKMALIANDSSLADFFNNAAYNYLKNNGLQVTNKSDKTSQEIN